MPLSRPRMTSVKARMYDPQKQHKIIARTNLEDQHKQEPLFEGPLHLQIVFYMAIPSSLSLRKQRLLDGAYHTAKPDLDNLIKYVNDICTGIVFKDDAIVASVSCRKIYDKTPRTNLTITSVNAS